ATEVLIRIHNLLETGVLHRSLKDQNISLENRVEERTHELRLSQLEVLERLARTAEARDDDTGRHTARVGELSRRLAEAAGISESRQELLRRAAPLHDLGKVGIPDIILRKPGNLTCQELAIMRTHTTIGAELLSGGKSEIMKMAERIAMSHHEWWNGEGYPSRIGGADIPIEARLVAIADCFDALSHDRPYRDAWKPDRVIQEIQRCRRTHFDPALVDAMLDTGCYRNLSLTAA
ncbi:MAG TPA: HD domain-containing phosphohydrolase, partial [Gemmatimonadaceae bacterium]|nr:HD domain-containing phosphohydrolase [Gemmatimonadaceae bacterium]